MSLVTAPEANAATLRADVFLELVQDFERELGWQTRTGGRKIRVWAHNEAQWQRLPEVQELLAHRGFRVRRASWLSRLFGFHFLDVSW